ncbi:MAG TPA: type II toxin-antitoxin system RatA family toxin [Burkholderiales bacterium]|nr:type II toxin-antitoxin system RatA family toxin [Burkholderiales bacterium]
MPQIDKSVLVEYSAEQMFALVDGVEDYPKFLPWCGGTHLIERSESITLATINIDYHGIRQSFTTRNRKEPPEWMHIELQEGPFQHLIGHWRFKPLGEGACKVEFRLEYEFSSKLLQKIVGPVFSYIANTFVEAFVTRAEAKYGPGSGA